MERIYNTDDAERYIKSKLVESRLTLEDDEVDLFVSEVINDCQEPLKEKLFGISFAPSERDTRAIIIGHMVDKILRRNIRTALLRAANQKADSE